MLFEPVLVKAPDNTEFSVWGRNSGIHWDCSVDVVGIYDEENEYHKKYHGHKCHPENSTDTINHRDDIILKIKDGKDL